MKSTSETCSKSFSGENYEYTITRENEKVWITIRDHDSEYLLFDYSDGLYTDRLTTFIDELMEIRDYINTHPEFQGENEE